MTLSSQVIYFVRLGFLHDADEVRCIGKVSVMQMKLYILIVGILIQMVDAFGIEQRTSPFDSMDDLSLVQEIFRQICAILAGNACDECDFPQNQTTPFSLLQSNR